MHFSKLKGLQYLFSLPLARELTLSKTALKKNFPKSDKEFLERYFKDTPKGLKKFKLLQFSQDLASSLRIPSSAVEVIVSNKVIKLGQINVNRMADKQLDLYLLASTEPKVITLLINNAREEGHPGGVIVPAVRGWMTEEGLDDLRRKGFDILEFADFLRVKNNHFIVKDIRDIQRILESDASLCRDEEWKPRKVRILEEDFLVELPPYWYNAWKNAFETEGYGEGDFENYEAEKEMMYYRVANESETLEFSVHIKHDPGFLRNNWKIIENTDQRTGEKKPLLYFNDTDYADTRVVSRYPSSENCRARIQQQRHNRLSLSAKNPQSQKLCQIVEDGRSVRYGKRTYRFTGPKRWDILRALLNADGNYIPFEKAIQPNFQQNIASLAFFKRAIEAEGQHRNGTGHYRLNLYKKQKPQK